MRQALAGDGRRIRLESLTAAVVVTAAAAVVYWRLYYGVDFTDESFYVAVPYRLVLGARPYVDELDVTQQTTALLLYPFVWTYAHVVGLTGIVLFVRHLQFLLSILAAACVYAPLRPLVGRSRAALVAAVLVLFVPFDIHSVSYDSLGTELFAAGCILGLPAPQAPRAARLAAAAACLGVAAFAYPPLLPAVVLAASLRVVVTPRGARRPALRAALLAVALPLAAFAFLAAHVGAHTVVADYEHSSRYLGQAGGIGKLAGIAGHEWHGLRLRYPLLVALGLIAAGWRRRRPPAAALVAVLPVLVLPSRPLFYAASLEYVAHLAWLAPFLLILVRRRPGAVPMFVAVWLPSLAGGLLTAYSSSNAGTNLAIGFLPGAVVSAVFLVWALDGVRFASALVPLVAIDLLLGLFVAVPVYRDGHLPTLTARVREGPYAGLSTSRGKVRFLDRLQSDVGRLPRRCRIVFLDDFPAGYLLTSATPDTNADWIATVAPAQLVSYRDALLRYYRRNGFPNVVVLMRRIPYAANEGARLEGYRPIDPMLRAVRARSFRVVASRFDYRVYARPPACAHSG